MWSIQEKCLTQFPKDSSVLEFTQSTMDLPRSVHLFHVLGWRLFLDYDHSSCPYALPSQTSSLLVACD